MRNSYLGETVFWETVSGLKHGVVVSQDQEEPHGYTVEMIGGKVVVLQRKYVEDQLDLIRIERRYS